MHAYEVETWLLEGWNLKRSIANIILNFLFIHKNNNNSTNYYQNNNNNNNNNYGDLVVVELSKTNAKKALKAICPGCHTWISGNGSDDDDDDEHRTCCRCMTEGCKNCTEECDNCGESFCGECSEISDHRGLNSCDDCANSRSS